jgi:hypothetical protein
MTPLSKEYRTRFDYFLSAVGSHNSDECLLWPFSVDRDGYGKLTYYDNGKELKVSAHRLAFKFVHGRWPEPLGLHSCDTPGCFNPRHITEGTHLVNQNEKAARKRSLRGEQQHDAKLTKELVIAARLEYAEGNIGFRGISHKYGVTETAIRLAITGKTWKHVLGAVATKGRQRERQSFCRRGHMLTDENCYIYEGSRQCKACTTIRTNEIRSRKAAK